MRIGIDIGGTKIVAGLTDNSGKVLAKKRILVGYDKRYRVVRDAIINLVRSILSESMCMPKPSIELALLPQDR